MKTFLRLVFATSLVLFLDSCALLPQGAQDWMVEHNSYYRNGGSRGVDSSDYGSNSGSYSNSGSTCTQCSGQGQVKRQDAWGSDSNGQLIDRYHWERCTWCNGAGYR